MSRLEDDWFGPKAGLLAAGKPLPQRRPSSPSEAEKFLQRGQPPPSARQYREGIDPIPNVGPLREQPTIGGLNQALQQPWRHIEEDMSLKPPYPTPGEYLPLPGEELSLGDIIQRFSPRRSGSF